MRVTEAIKQNSSMASMTKNSAEVNRLGENISTGRRVLVPSDDPVASVKSEESQRSLTVGKAVNSNINTASSVLDAVDFTLEEAGELLKEAKVLTVQAANGATTEESLTATGIQMDKLLSRLVDLSNTKVGKTYLFAGTKSLTQPVQLNKTGKLGDIQHPSTVWKTNISMADKSKVEQEAYFAKEGIFQMNFIDENEKVHHLNIQLNNVDTAEELVNEINDGIVKFYRQLEGRKPDRETLGLRAQVGADGAVYIESSAEKKITDINTDIFKSSGIDFELLKEKDWVKYPNALSDKNSGFSHLYGEKLDGQPSMPFTIKIVEGGRIGSAKYVLLDNDKNRISEEPEKLQSENKLKDPADSDKSLRFTLEGATAKDIYLAEGLEFRFYPDSYAVYQGNTEVKSVPLDDGKREPITVNAKELFFGIGKDGVNTFDLLKETRDAMFAANQENIASKLDAYDTALSQLLETRSKAGSSKREMDVAGDRTLDNNITHQEKLSELVDQDFAEAATSLSRAQLKQEATFNTTSKMIQPGLIKFLS